MKYISVWAIYFWNFGSNFRHLSSSLHHFKTKSSLNFNPAVTCRRNYSITLRGVGVGARL
jgi:hypothetical protein